MLRRAELEQRVLTALQTRFFEDGPFEVFCHEFAGAVNEARMESHAASAVAARERGRLPVAFRLSNNQQPYLSRAQMTAEQFESMRAALPAA